jgi:hypothetical protein
MNTAERERLREARFARPIGDEDLTQPHAHTFGENPIMHGDIEDISVPEALFDEGPDAVRKFREGWLAALAHDRPSGVGSICGRAFCDRVDCVHDRPSGSLTFCGKCSHPMHWHECGSGADTTAGPCRCRNDVSGSSNPEAVGLDVERLARALHTDAESIESDPTDWEDCPDSNEHREYAASLAAEYARLTEAKTEPPA